MKVIVRKNVMAAMIGVALAAAIVPSFDYWLAASIEREGDADTLATSRRAIVVADSAIEQVVGALKRLEAAGVTSCSGEGGEAMRRAVFTVMPIKGLSIVSADGTVICSNVSNNPGSSKTVATQSLASEPGYRIDAVDMQSGRRMLRVRRDSGGVSAVVPSQMILPRIAPEDDGGFRYAAALKFNGSQVVAVSGGISDEDAHALFSASATSQKFGFTVAVEMPRSRVTEDRADLRWVVLMAACLAAATSIGVALLRPPASPPNPVTQLEAAIKAGEIVPYYQPIVDIRTGQLRGAEVLARWKKPDGSLVMPSSFIPLAESSGLLRAMTLHLMKTVCAEVGEVIGRRPALKISFNFSVQLVSQKTIIDDIDKIFSRSPISCQQLVIELTERDQIQNFTETRRIVAELQALGCRIAIDDVGTGHSGLSYMLKLGVDIIKIDKIFVDALGTDRNSTTIVETLIDLAHNMRMDIVAEGVESFDQVMILRELGVRSAQGFVFAPPLPGRSFLQLVEAADPAGAGEAKGWDSDVPDSLARAANG